MTQDTFCDSASHKRLTEQTQSAASGRRIFALVGAIAATAVLAIVVSTTPSANPQSVLEATVRMERLAAALGKAKVVAPETADRLAYLVQQPRYSCEQIVCDGALADRNRRAREKLWSLLLKGTPRKELASQIPSASGASAK